MLGCFECYLEQETVFISVLRSREYIMWVWIKWIVNDISFRHDKVNFGLLRQRIIVRVIE